MQIILLERVENLGFMGSLVNVKPGYARNYLLPRKKAMRATKENIAYFEKQKAQLEANNLNLIKEAQQVADKMKDLTIVMVRQAGDSDQLYGSVTANDIAKGITSQGFTVNRNQISIDHPIKLLGIHKIRVRLHPEVSIDIKINVAKSAEEAKLQAEATTADADANDAKAAPKTKTTKKTASAKETVEAEAKPEKEEDPIDE